MPNTVFQKSKQSPKRKTVKVTLWVKPLVKAEIERRAERAGLSLSATGAAFLEKALQADIDMQYGTLLRPVIEKTIATHMRSYSSRIAMLLVRSVFASEQTRSLSANILGRQQGVTQQVLEDILNRSNQTAKRNITRITPQLTELLTEVEQWIEQGGEKQNA